MFDCKANMWLLHWLQSKYWYCFSVRQNNVSLLKLDCFAFSIDKRFLEREPIISPRHNLGVVLEMTNIYPWKIILRIELYQFFDETLSLVFIQCNEQSCDIQILCHSFYSIINSLSPGRRSCGAKLVKTHQEQIWAFLVKKTLRRMPQDLTDG